MNGRARRFAALAALALAVVPIRGVATIADKIESTQSQIEATHKRLEDRRSRLQLETVRASDLRTELAATTASMAQVSARLGTIGTQIHWNQRTLASNRVQLDAAQTTLRRHDAALRRRLIDAYERGDLGYLNVLLSATSFSEFVERWDDIRFLILANERSVRERQSAERAVSFARATLERRRQGLVAAEDRQQRTQRQLAALAAQRAQLAGAAEAARRSTATEVAQLENLSASQESALEELIRQRQAQEAALLAAEAEQRRRAAQLAGQALPPATNLGAPGTFSWPASGPITSPFGMRADPFGRGGFEMHTGIDIGAPMGSTITAAATGRVIFAGWYGGYGNAIIIDHGGNTSTLYGHCSQIFVTQGQDVTRGQAIGAVGSTGVSTGPHLHFEIRVNGVPIEPTSRLQ